MPGRREHGHASLAALSLPARCSLLSRAPVNKSRTGLALSEWIIQLQDGRPTTLSGSFRDRPYPVCHVRGALVWARDLSSVGNVTDSITLFPPIAQPLYHYRQRDPPSSQPDQALLNVPDMRKDRKGFATRSHKLQQVASSADCQQRWRLAEGRDEPLQSRPGPCRRGHYLDPAEREDNVTGCPRCPSTSPHQVLLPRKHRHSCIPGTLDRGKGSTKQDVSRFGYHSTLLYMGSFTLSRSDESQTLWVVHGYVGHWTSIGSSAISRERPRDPTQVNLPARKPYHITRYAIAVLTPSN
ncbi:uncharacterized protein MYCGRDRAFT_107279 [Zymoseptoria tritici IPO323]|uniref:Uncharacterized protein n=1 Tax=Zymoseptoria tritici (strain CBS 115943 / IPO323) TaxID=336722 RepID=F9X148_ZYMTI|nr:uncharacterized protein MYCGRDRAFT_107279 [Zymoseptoria tritici IPO323]EGP92296.1 hypothetical protein MYCGRDRAFT_107279 [Zymoseptoria tritici IPO323]